MNTRKGKKILKKVVSKKRRIHAKKLDDSFIYDNKSINLYVDKWDFD